MHAFQVRPHFDRRNRAQAKATRAARAVFPNGDSGVVLMRGATPFLVLPDADAYRVIDSIADVMEQQPTPTREDAAAA